MLSAYLEIEYSAGTKTKSITRLISARSKTVSNISSNDSGSNSGVISIRSRARAAVCVASLISNPENGRSSLLPRGQPDTGIDQAVGSSTIGADQIPRLDRSPIGCDHRVT